MTQVAKDTTEAAEPSVLLRLSSVRPATVRRLAAWLGYPLFFVFCFLVFAYWTFPYDRLKHFAIQQIEAQRSDLDVEITSLSPWWFSGVHATGVRLTFASEQADASPTTILIDELWASASLPSLLVGNVRLQLEALVGPGSLKASYASREAGDRVEATFADVDLGRLGVLAMALGLPVQGRLDGTLALDLTEDTKDTAGQLDLNLTRLIIGDGKRKLQLPGMGDGLTLEPLEAGELTIRAAVENGQATFEQFRGHGPDLELDVSGNVQLARELSLSRLNLLLTAHFTEHFKQKSDRTKVLFELLDMNPALKQAKTPDGALSYRITGAGKAVRAVPAGGTVRR